MTPFANQLLAYLRGLTIDGNDFPTAEELIQDFTFLRRQGVPGIPENVAHAVHAGLGELLGEERVEAVGGRWRWLPERARAPERMLFS